MELERKSVEELKELLEKQEKLLQNKNLIKSLPDHGKKIALFIEKIQKTLERRNSVDDAVERLNQIRLGDPSDKRINYANSYEFVIKQNSDVQMKKYPQNFKPNRLTKDKRDKSSKPELSNVKSQSSDMPKIEPTNVERKSCESTDVTMSPSTNENSQPPTTTRMDQGNETQRKLKSRYDASLEEMFPYERKHAHGTQLISIQEGMNLLKQHHVALQEAEMKRAESMLAASVNTKLSTDLSTWRGDRFDRYREEQGASDGEESDDDDNERGNENMDIKSSDDDDNDCDGVD